MLKAYFDTNVYSNITDGSVSAKEVEDVHAALTSGKLIVRISLANVEELLGDWERDRTVATRRLQAARDLIGFKRILKQPYDLLHEAIKAYADGKTQPPPTLPRDLRRGICTHLNKIASGKAHHDPVVTEIIAEVRAQKEAFKNIMKQSHAKVYNDLCHAFSQHSRCEISRELSQGSFDQSWGDAPEWAEAFAARCNLDAACRERGLEGLLDVRRIRLCVVAAKALAYFQTTKGRQPHLGDRYDLWHVILASVADVFVTFDKRLAHNLGLVSVDDFRVVTSLRELLDLI